MRKPGPRYTFKYTLCRGPLHAVSMLQGEALHRGRKPRPCVKGAGRGLAQAEALHFWRKSRPCRSPDLFCHRKVMGTRTWTESSSL